MKAAQNEARALGLAGFIHWDGALGHLFDVFPLPIPPTVVLLGSGVASPPIPPTVFLPGIDVYPPTVTLPGTGEWLMYKAIDDEGRGFGDRAPTTRLINQFVRLADAPAEQVCSFAQRWGVLFVCKEHNLPMNHNQFVGDRGLELTWAGPPIPRGCEPYTAPSPYNDGLTFLEPIERWRHYAREARAILMLAANLQRNTPRSAEDWCLLGEQFKKPDLASERRSLAGRINLWYGWGGVRPYFQWAGSAPRIQPYSFGLFGTLAMQLGYIISHQHGVARCSHCGEPYAPETRTPTASKRNFCPECRQAKVPERLASRDRYRRERDKKAEARGSKVQ